MAGTNRTQDPIYPPEISIILVEPALPENVGMAARAMLNCGLSDLRVVNPRWIQEGLPLVHEKAVAASAGADELVQSMQAYTTLESALKDISYLVATSPRVHDIQKPVLTPDESVKRLHAAIKTGNKCAVMFGCEKSGLTNEQITFADSILNVPLNPMYSSLNLAQAVLLVAYEWQKFNIGHTHADTGLDPVAPIEEQVEFFERLENELDYAGFLRVEEKRNGMIQNIRNIFARAGLSSQEVRTLHGILTYLLKPQEQKEQAKTFFAQQRINRQQKKQCKKNTS